MKNKPAFPTKIWKEPDAKSQNWADDGGWNIVPGLTKKELVSAMILQGLLSNPGLIREAEGGSIAYVKDLEILAVVKAEKLIETWELK